MGSAVTQVEQQDAEAFVVEVVREHASALLALARRYSYCADDAADAYQRGLEIFLRRAGDVERATAVSWLKTVIKHEALSVRAGRSEGVITTEVDLDRQEATRLPTADEQIARFDRATRAAEALQRLKPQEVTALLLKARGTPTRRSPSRPDGRTPR
jgi:DNA-directed RNA polymerase specialized sigma24 family protein